MKNFFIGLLIGLILGAGGVFIFYETIQTGVDEGKSQVGHTMKKAGRKLEKAGDKIAD